MKKSLFTLIVLSLCSLLAAQFIVWRNGQIVYQSGINEVDSITLYEYNLPDTPDEPDTPDTPDKPSEPKYIIVKAKVPSSWDDDVTAWIWATDEEGREVRATRDGDWWVVTAHCAELNVIFKNGWGWNGDVNQTEEIAGIRENTCYQLKQIGAQKATAIAVDCPEVVYRVVVTSIPWLLVGETKRISYSLMPEYANEIFGVEFISSNKEVATVSADGVITAVSEGNATITVRVKGGGDIKCEDTIIDVVVKHPTLVLNLNQFTLKIGAEKRIKTTVTPATDENYIVNWESSNPEVATVDNNGNVVAIAVGNTVITATIEGSAISATASVTVIDPFDLKFYTMALMSMDENFYQIDGVDSNEDGENDTIYAVTFYVLPESMYLQENSLVGDDDYMLIMNTAISVCYDAALGGKVFYSLGGYTFSDVEEEYCVEIDGKKRLLPHTATYTHLKTESYCKYYENVIIARAEGKIWPSTQDEYDAFLTEYGFYRGDLDSYVAYVNVESQSVVDAGYIVSGAGLECGSNGDYDLDFYEFGLKLFAKPYAYGFATEMAEDPETGEMVEYFIWPPEMGEMVEKTYTFGEPRTEAKQKRVKDNNFGAVPFVALKKQMAVNRMLFKPLNYKGDLRAR